MVDAQLEADLARLRSLTLLRPSETGSALVDLVRRLITVARSIEKATPSPGSDAVDAQKLMQLGANRQASIEATRGVNSEAIEVLERIRARLRILARHGLGDPPALGKRPG